MEQVFIWHTEPTWFSPSAQHALNTESSSTCFAVSGSQSETQIPLSPCCFQVRLEGIRVLLAVPMAVITFPNEAGMGCPANFSRVGLGSNVSMWLGPPSMNSQITDFAVGLKCGCLGANGSTTVAPDALETSPSAD